MASVGVARTILERPAFNIGDCLCLVLSNLGTLDYFCPNSKTTMSKLLIGISPKLVPGRKQDVTFVIVCKHYGLLVGKYRSFTSAQLVSDIGQSALADELAKDVFDTVRLVLLSAEAVDTGDYTVLALKAFL